MSITATVIQWVIVRYDGNTRVRLCSPQQSLANVKTLWDFRKDGDDKNCRVVRQHLCGKTKHVFLEVTEFGFNLEK
jgi:hypothetical protein